MKKQLTCLLFVIILIFGCQDNNAGPEPNKTIRAGRLIISGIDDTGSYKLREQVKNMIARIINDHSI